MVVGEVGAEVAREAGGGPAPAGMVPPAPVPVIVMDWLALPLSTLTLPMAMVPSWQDRHRRDRPPGPCESSSRLASIELEL